MGQLTVKESVADSLRQIAAAKGESEETILENALQLYWREYEREKIRAEQDAWEAKPVEFRAQYRDRFVAVHNGDVVDSDADLAALSKPVRARFGKTPVLLTEGGEEIFQEARIRSPRLVKDAE